MYTDTQIAGVQTFFTLYTKELGVFWAGRQGPLSPV